MSHRRKTSRKLNESSSSSKWEYPILGLLAIGAFLLRVVGQLDKIFVGDNVWFRGVDSWYHMRLADSMVVNFPNFLKWDMFSQYPSGHETGYLPLLSWLVAIFGQIGNYEVVAAYLPPILGSLTLIPIYLIGKEVFNGKVGLLACLLIATLPGEFLHRTLLGFTDHHALESLLMSTTLLFLLYSYRTLKWKWMILAGISLSLYHLSWAGTSFLLLILGLWVWFEFLRRFKNNEDIYPLFKIVSIPVGTGFLISFPFLSNQAILISIGVLSVTTGLWLITKYIKDREQILFGLTILVPLGLAIMGFYYSWHSLLITFFWKGTTTVQESAFLDPLQILSIYGIPFLLMIGGLWFCPRNKYTGLFLIWALVLILIGVGQRRWGYYTTIPIGILAAYFTYRITLWVKPQTRIAVAIVVIFFMLLPSIRNTIQLSQMPNNINADWYVALTWLRQNTPNSFSEEHDYYKLEIEEGAKYGILSWWDYGHWIIRIGRRVPISSPTLGSGTSAPFFTSLNEEEAEKALQGKNIRYVIIDRTLIEGKWYAVARRGGKEGLDVRESFIWKLWIEEAEGYKRIYERGDIKIYEREIK